MSCRASSLLTFLLSRTQIQITTYITSFVVHISLDLVNLALIQNLEKGESSGRLEQHQHLQPSHNSTSPQLKAQPHNETKTKTKKGKDMRNDQHGNIVQQSNSPKMIH